MSAGLRPIDRPRCILLYALAPEGLSPAEADRPTYGKDTP